MHGASGEKPLDQTSLSLSLLGANILGIESASVASTLCCPPRLIASNNAWEQDFSSASCPPMLAAAQPVTANASHRLGQVCVEPPPNMTGPGRGHISRRAPHCTCEFAFHSGTITVQPLIRGLSCAQLQQCAAKNRTLSCAPREYRIPAAGQ